ncbi:hypothetical protein PoB_004893700 [Plakobranchus ocellatus]|uniref:Uncharacterized protein n=1 Tax=Plakobranchus ocellatus TaxID=259542 RepID=A0AAV4BSQ1_9GAST|nr:hypothetical protein PoB_004893700 [Plakobranchus ocellatus]
MEERNTAVKSKFIKSINYVSKWVHQNKFVSFLLFMSGAVIISAMSSQDHTPSAPERAEWRRKRLQLMERSNLPKNGQE